MVNPCERDIRGAIRDLLDASGAFDGVYLSGLPEDRGERGGDLRAAVVEPHETTVASRWDDVSGPWVMTSRVTLVFMARDDDPQVRDEEAERLLNTAAAILNGSSLAASTLPGSTRVRSWTWQKPTAPERRISAVFEFQYLAEGCGSHDSSV